MTKLTIQSEKTTSTTHRCSSNQMQNWKQVMLRFDMKDHGRHTTPTKHMNLIYI